jgi:hypothetical protein
LSSLSLTLKYPYSKSSSQEILQRITIRLCSCSNFRSPSPSNYQHILYYWAKHFEYRAAWCSGKDPDLNGRFEPCGEYRLSWLKLFMIFLSSSRQILGRYFDSVMGVSLKIFSNLSLTSYSAVATM